MVEPAQINLRYSLAAAAQSTDVYIDLARDLSRVNRRLYEQGRSYYVAGMTVVNSGATGAGVGAKTAGNTWCVHNSWKKGKAKWLEQQKQALDAVSPSAKPVWQDFKVFLDAAHRAGTTLDVLDGSGSSGTAVLSGEWSYSQFVYDDAGTVRQPYIHIVGADVGTTDVGLVEAYEESRPTVSGFDPATPHDASESIYAKIDDHDEMIDELINNMEADNDQPPYDNDQYTGGADNAPVPWFQSLGTANVNAPIQRMNGFVAECGLIKLSYTAETQTALLVHLMPGGYKGVAAEAMGQ